MPTDKDRWIVWFRDGFRCVYCGYEGTILKTQNLTIDHKTPVPRGGADAIPNLQTICVVCKVEKGQHSDGEYRELLARQRPLLAS